jgi:hypothetical protein
VFHDHKWGNFNAIDKEVLEFVHLHKKDLPVARVTVRMKALEVSASLKILWQDFEASNVWALRCMHHKGLGLHWRTTVAQKCPTLFLEK